MTPEDKKLLLQDLCARLPYGLKVKCGNTATKEICELVGINAEISSVSIKDIWAKYYLESVASIKPYLRPMAYITKKELNELSKCIGSVQKAKFYYKHQLDCNFLIEKGLAIEAPKKMYKI